MTRNAKKKKEKKRASSSQQGNTGLKKSQSTLQICGQVGEKYFHMLVNNAEAGKTRGRKNR